MNWTGQIIASTLKVPKPDKASSKVNPAAAKQPLPQLQPTLTAAAAKRRIRGQRFSSPIKVVNEV